MANAMASRVFQRGRSGAMTRAIGLNGQRSFPGIDRGIRSAPGVSRHTRGGGHWFTLQAAPADGMHWMTDAEMAKYTVYTHLR